MVKHSHPRIPHPHVPHPRELRQSQDISKFNVWVTHHLTLALGSVAGMYFALVIPLIAFEIPPLLKIIGLVSSYWIQLWALFVLQRSANVADSKRDAKADADHEALTHIANVSDEIRNALSGSSLLNSRVTAGDIIQAKRDRPPGTNL